MSGIDNLVNYVDQQKDGTISGAEWQLVAKVFGAPALKEGETFSKKDIKELDKEEQQKAREHNTKEKKIQEDNKSLEKAQEVLNSPENIKKLLHMCEVQAKLIKNGADVVYYESFLNSIPVGGLKDDDTIKQSIDGIQKIILDEKEKKKITLDLSQNSSNNGTLNPKEVIYETYKAGETGISAKKADILQYKTLDGAVNSMDFQEMAKEFEKIGPQINEFTNDINEGLKTGKFDMKKMEMYGAIGYMMGELRGQFGTTAEERKVAIQKLYAEVPKMLQELNTNPLLSESAKQMIKKMLPVLKSVLDALADPNSQLSLYIDHIAEPLAQQINGSLDYTNLESDQSKKAILNIFHRNPIEFNRLIDDFSGVDAAKKSQAEQIIKAYYKIDSGDALPVGATIEYHPDMLIKQVFNNKQEIISTTKKQGFQFKDSNGNILKEKNSSNELMLYFGEKSTGNAQSFEQLLGANGPQWAKDLYKAKDGTVQLNMKTVADLAQQVNFEGGTKVKPPSSLNVYSNMSEAIKGFFDHPLFKQLQEALYTLMGLVGTPEQREKAALDLNRMRSLNTIKANNDSIVTRKGKKLMIDAIKDNDYAFKEESMSYIDKNKQKQDIKINTKAVFVNMTYEEQKFFLENILSGDAQKVQAAKDSMIAIHNNENPISTNTDKSKDEASEQKQENSTQGKEISVGQPYDALKLNQNITGLTGKVELSQDKKILTVDGQVVALQESQDKKTSSGVIHVSNKENTGFIEHTLTVDVASGKVSLIEGTQSISLDANNTVIKTVYENGKLKLPIAAGQEKLFNYFAFSKSVDSSKPNLIDEVYKNLPKDSLALKDFQTKFAKLQSDFALLAVKDGTTIANLIDKSGLKDIKLDDTKKQGALATTLNNWKAMFITEEPKTVAKASVVEKV